MRIACAGLAALALALAGGCRSDNGAVLLHLSPDAVTPIAPGTYSASEAAVVFDPDGAIHFGASSNEGTLRLELTGPLEGGAILELPAGPPVLELDLEIAPFVNQGGTISVASAAPTIIQFVSVPMVPRDGGGGVSFVIDGQGTFR
ncbi:MAG TPA: hypothetical protein VN947_21960 [Polyangia bacterium]|nr:hypothetical protein [Polyangia bacterium]